MENRTLTKLALALGPHAKDSFERKQIVEGLWYDWFCRGSSLYNKGEKLLSRFSKIRKSSKIDHDNMYLWFKNNCPVNGRLYDDFRLSDTTTGNVVYTIIPSVGYSSMNGEAVVWGRENDFKEPLVRGTWMDVVRWFNG